MARGPRRSGPCAGRRIAAKPQRPPAPDRPPSARPGATDRAGPLGPTPPDDQLLGDLHSTICAPVAPHLAGWRRVAVAIGSHIAPAWPLVPTLMRDYGRDLAARIAAHGLAPRERLIETLAFAEGRLLAIHPFADYNGRVTRVFLRLLLRRLELPPVRLAPGDDGRADYLAALAAADCSDWSRLMGVWKRRIDEADEPGPTDTGCDPEQDADRR